MEMDEGNSEIDMQKLPQVSEVRLLFCFFFFRWQNLGES